MPRGKYPRVSSNSAVQASVPLEETQDWSAPATSNPIADVRADIQPLLLIARLAERVATRYLAGKMGMALENDARAIREAIAELPEGLL